MTDTQRIAHLRQEALQECEKCGGKRFGDCDDCCRYFFAGTQQEARGTPWSGLKAAGRGWLGAAFHGLDEKHDD